MKVTYNTPETVSITLEMTRNEAHMLLDMMLLDIALPEHMIRHHDGYGHTGAAEDIGDMMTEFVTALSKIL